MTALAARILIPLVVVGAIIAAFLHMNARLDAATARAELAASEKQAAEGRITEQAKTIDVLATRMLDDHQAAKRLNDLSNNLAAAQRRAEQKIERLTHENAEYRRWAAEQLPADVVRMRERPEITGGQGYLDWLSARDALPTAGDQPQPERTPEP